MCSISHWSSGFLTNKEYRNISLKADVSFSLMVERRVAEFYHNVDRRRYLFGLVHLTYFHHYWWIGGIIVIRPYWQHENFPCCNLQVTKWAYLIISSNIIGYSKWNGLLEREFIGNKWGNLLDCFATQPWPTPHDTSLWADLLCTFVTEGCSTSLFWVNKNIA